MSEVLKWMNQRKSITGVLVIELQGLQAGKQSVSIEAPASEIPDMFPEFKGIVTVAGTVEKFENKYILSLQARCVAHLVCDRSSEEYEEEIVVPIAVTFIRNSELYAQQKLEADPEPPFYIHDDAKYLDITDYVRQELALHLPMKRVAPWYRDKELEDIFPFLQRQEREREQQIDERWSVLQKLRFDEESQQN